MLALWHTTFESGEVRETIINGTPLCAIHQIRLQLVKSYSNCQVRRILPCEVKELLYRAFVLPHFYYCSQVWHHCGSRNTKKIEKVNERALRYVYKEKTSAYHELLQQIG